MKTGSEDRRQPAGPARFYDRSRVGGWPEPHAGRQQRNARRPVGREPSSTTQPVSAARRQRGRREAWGWILAIVGAVIAAFLIRAFLFEIILVDGESMMPTLLTDERIGIEKVTRYASLPERGDIVIVRYPDMEGTYVKRTIGLPGETVNVRDSTVYINGLPLYEDYVSQEPYADMDPVLVPEDHIFVMGDNRAHSMDSRASYIGPISKDAILGHGLFVLWPFDNIHMINNDRAISAPAVSADE